MKSTVVTCSLKMELTGLIITYCIAEALKNAGYNLNKLPHKKSVSDLLTEQQRNNVEERVCDFFNLINRKTLSADSIWMYGCALNNNGTAVAYQEQFINIQHLLGFSYGDE